MLFAGKGTRYCGDLTREYGSSNNYGSGVFVLGQRGVLPGFQRTLCSESAK